MPRLPRPKKRKRVRRQNNGWGDQKFLHSKRWKSLRAVHLRYEPLCQIHAAAGYFLDCTDGGHVDHIIPRSKGGAELDNRNLMTLCKSCHHMKTGLETRNDIIEPAPSTVHGAFYPTSAEKQRLITELSKRI